MKPHKSHNPCRDPCYRDAHLKIISEMHTLLYIAAWSSCLAIESLKAWSGVLVPSSAGVSCNSMFHCIACLAFVISGRVGKHEPQCLEYFRFRIDCPADCCSLLSLRLLLSSAFTDILHQNINLSHTLRYSSSFFINFIIRHKHYHSRLFLGTHRSLLSTVSDTFTDMRPDHHQYAIQDYCHHGHGCGLCQ